MLSERRIKLCLDGGSNKSSLVKRGLPQGSILSPILYNVYTYDLEAAPKGKIGILLYADDLLLYVSDKDIPRT